MKEVREQSSERAAVGESKDKDMAICGVFQSSVGSCCGSFTSSLAGLAARLPCAGVFVTFV